MDKYYKSKDAVKALKVTENTLRRWSKEGTIDFILTPGKHRLYNVPKYLLDNGVNIIESNELSDSIKKNKIKKLRCCYCRVSTSGQKDDLERQVKLLESLYPDYEIIRDIGSGINFKRKGLLKIINLAIENKLEEVVIAYKDRLCRFGYDLLEHIITTYSNGKITIVNKVSSNPEDEVVKDLVQIINVFSAKLNGSRKYKKKKEKNNEIL